MNYQISNAAIVSQFFLSLEILFNFQLSFCCIIKVEASSVLQENHTVKMTI